MSQKVDYKCNIHNQRITSKRMTTRNNLLLFFMGTVLVQISLTVKPARAVSAY